MALKLYAQKESRPNTGLNQAVYQTKVKPAQGVVYKIFRRDRITSTQGGGGVFIAVKENYDVSLLPDTVTDTGLLWAKVHFEKSKSLILGSFYRPPGAKIKKMEEFSRSLDLLQKIQTKPSSLVETLIFRT